ncbi:transposase [Bradyrhizobium sp.]|uniref:transposase n=1 Tax=Bradyrhizobium sp. TaxID=376 RepID=UPI001DBA5DD4|nr:transposase [Bradyrhizobium sp.]MBV8701842.1 transposase [Bradyrhizobium sp.]MBV8922548.1 transposase [Bradyrhizobium sp.]MBV9981575.1 transposase [Bradyrhizobium sp.]
MGSSKGGYFTLICYHTFFCGHHLLAAKPRPIDIDAGEDPIEEIARIVAQIRQRGRTRVSFCAPTGRFARDALMSWCKANEVGFIFGSVKNVLLCARARPSSSKPANAEPAVAEHPHSQSSGYANFQAAETAIALHVIAVVLRAVTLVVRRVIRSKSQ